MIITIGVGLVLAAFYNFVNKWTSYFGKKISKPNRKKRKIKRPSKAAIEKRNKDNKMKSLPPFNHEGQNNTYMIKEFAYDRIGKHRVVPLYKKGNRVMVVTETSSDKIKGNKNLRLSNGKYLGSQLHSKIDKKQIKNSLFKQKNIRETISYDKSELLTILNNFKSKTHTNLDTYFEFLKEKKRTNK